MSNGKNWQRLCELLLWSHARRSKAVGMAVALSLMLVVGPAAADDYKLGPMDKLNIRVVDWQPGEAMLRQWPVLTGEFIIGPEGELSMPFAGVVKARGRSTQEVATDLTHLLQNKLGLSEPPSISVEVSEFRPIYVAGDVQTPGKYPFEHEMTALKAVSLAGGPRRSVRSEQRFERDLLSAKGNYDLLRAEHSRLLVQQARLEAELGNRTDLEIGASTPPRGNPEREDTISKEKALLLSRQQKLTAQRSALEQRRALFQKEVEALSKSQEELTRRLKLINLEMARIKKLADQKLVSSTFVLSLELTASDTQSKLLEIETAAVRSRQEINRISADLDEIESRHKIELITDLQKTKSAAAETLLKMDMFAGLMGEALANEPAVASLMTSRSDSLFSYMIVRTSNDRTEEIPATEITILQPGDVVKYSLNESEDLKSVKLNN